MQTKSNAAIRELSLTEINATSGGLASLGMAIATNIALQAVADKVNQMEEGNARANGSLWQYRMTKLIKG